jgi:hypothetical protein
MAIKLLPRPGLTDDAALLTRLQDWMNERYAWQIKHVAHHYVGKRVRFVTLNNQLGTVTGACFTLDNENLFYYQVQLDDGQKLTDTLPCQWTVPRPGDEKAKNDEPAAWVMRLLQCWRGS